MRDTGEDAGHGVGRYGDVLLGLQDLESGLPAQRVIHPHRVHTREQLVEHVWGHTHLGGGRTVDVHIARLRRKPGAAQRQRIVPVRRVGYKYVPEA
ncbi:winged helix-turn-helix domain-containing protein [Streptomyces sp. NPDC007856]|uniref:winged helix-turn-helix domain-containing protein n=1 Tax=Streptomyces sp. NPDC007856 TaxID=3364781 RepID=UPI0036CD4F11